MRALIAGICTVAALAAGTAVCAAPAIRPGEPAPAWHLTHWTGGDPVELEDLRGQVVLVRWWTGPQCAYCRASAPVLQQLHERYADRGLVVIGVYHHKTPRPFDPGDLPTLARELGIGFPVALDPDWNTLRAWWLDGARKTDWTSLSVLVDRDGTVAAIHPGGRMGPGEPAAEALELQIETLLAPAYGPGLPTASTTAGRLEAQTGDTPR